MPRYVKLGRKPLPVGVGHHWAVRVETGRLDGCWYELLPDGSGSRGSGRNLGSLRGSNISGSSGDPDRNEIVRSHTKVAKSGAGALGGSTVGKTTKSDEEIDDFISRWLKQNQRYGVYAANCQTFATEFIAWLTDDNYNISVSHDAGKILTNSSKRTHAAAHEGTAYATASYGEIREALGSVTVAGRLPTAMAGVSAGTEGFYAVAEASAFRAEANYGNFIGGHIDLNVNTGAGVRNGNVEAHLLGFGGRVGTDGVEINTPLGGVRIPVLGAPINWIGGLFRLFVPRR